jgi:hypothetical protein
MGCIQDIRLHSCAIATLSAALILSGCSLLAISYFHARADAEAIARQVSTDRVNFCRQEAGLCLSDDHYARCRFPHWRIVYKDTLGSEKDEMVLCFPVRLSLSRL